MNFNTFLSKFKSRKYKKKIKMIKKYFLFSLIIFFVFYIFFSFFFIEKKNNIVLKKIFDSKEKICFNVDNLEIKNLFGQITLLNKANICTIDSFCLDVIKNHFFDFKTS